MLQEFRGAFLVLGSNGFGAEIYSLDLLGKLAGLLRYTAEIPEGFRNNSAWAKILFFLRYFCVDFEYFVVDIRLI